MDSTPAAAHLGPPSLVPGSVRGFHSAVLLVGFDAADSELLRGWLGEDGHRVSFDGAEGGESGFDPDIVVAAVDDAAAWARLGAARRGRFPRASVLAVTPESDPEIVLLALHDGASDCVVRPLEVQRLRESVERARAKAHLEFSLRRLEAGGKTRGLAGGLAGRSRAMSDLSSHLARVVDRDVAVFLEGEPGSGVDLAARAIHEAGSRSGGPFLTFDCSALDPLEHEPQLVGRELSQGRSVRGALEQANGGVLHIDNVGQLAPGAQAALASYLSTRQIRRLGGNLGVPLATRVIASADNDLRGLLAKNAFREDLYFRLVVYPIRIPPLRARYEDIPVIVGSLLRELAQQMGGEAPRTVSPDALAALVRYPWPGNVRELENVLQRSMLGCRGDAIELSDLPPEVRVGATVSEPANHNGEVSLFGDEIIPLREIERRAIEHALRVTDGNVAVAAKRLGIGRATLYRRIASLEVSVRVA